MAGFDKGSQNDHCKTKDGQGVLGASSNSEALEEDIWNMAPGTDLINGPQVPSSSRSCSCTPSNILA